MKHTTGTHGTKTAAMSYYMGYPIISDQIDAAGLDVVCRNLRKVLHQSVPGAIVEFGCYTGTTSLFLRRILDETSESAKRELHVYDSFAGLPAKQPQDQSAAGVDFSEGRLAISKKQFTQAFTSAGLTMPTIHKSWFNELSDSAVPNPIAFAFLDGDFYDSIISSLRLVIPRLSPGAVVLVDDYQREALPGVTRAIHDYFGHKVTHIQTEKNIGIIDISHK